MRNEIENKVESTLESLHGISRAEANPYLFEKIKAKLNTDPQPVSATVKWSWVSVCLMVLCINCGSVYYYFQKTEAQTKETAYESIGNEMGLGQNYNY